MCDKETKICTKCQQVKTLDLFYNNKSRRDGKSEQCKQCLDDRYRNPVAIENRRVWRKEWRKTTAGQKYTKSASRKQSIRSYEIRHKEKGLLDNARIRAKEKNLVCNISVKDIVIPDTCPVLGIPIRRDNSKLADDSPTIDRIDNSKGYTPDNICVISFKANSLKRNANVDELYKVVSYIRCKEENRIDYMI